MTSVYQNIKYIFVCIKDTSPAVYYYAESAGFSALFFHINYLSNALPQQQNVIRHEFILIYYIQSRIFLINLHKSGKARSASERKVVGGGYLYFCSYLLEVNRRRIDVCYDALSAPQDDRLLFCARLSRRALFSPPMQISHCSDLCILSALPLLRFPLIEVQAVATHSRD